MSERMFSETITYMFLLAGAVSMCIAIPFFVHAHGTGGEFTAAQDDVYVDIGYSPGELSTDAPVRFDFLLYESDKAQEEREFSNVWIQIKRENSTVFSGAIGVPSLGNPGFLYLFSEPGEYTLSARYMQDGQSITEFEETLTIAAGQNSASAGNGGFGAKSIGMALAGAFVGAVLAFVFMRRKNNA